jgi:hypothetical protein
MRRFVRILLALIVVFFVLIGAEWVRESSIQGTVDLRAFDAAELGRLDTAMWRSYYEQRPLRLFREMAELLRTQYHLPRLRAMLDAFRATRAALAFRGAKNRADYGKALPALESFYADINSIASQKFDPNEAARLELDWWIQHREKSPGLDNALAELQAVIYHQPASTFVEYAQLRATAMTLRDLKGGSITQEDWSRIGAMLDRSWLALWAAVNGKELAGGSRR